MTAPRVPTSTHAAAPKFEAGTETVCTSDPFLKAVDDKTKSLAQRGYYNPNLPGRKDWYSPLCLLRQSKPKILLSRGAKPVSAPTEIWSESAGFDAGISAYSYCLLLELDGTTNLSNIIQLYSEIAQIRRFDIGLTWQGLVRLEGSSTLVSSWTKVDVYLGSRRIKSVR
jgi:hypothetical protein